MKLKHYTLLLMICLLLPIDAHSKGDWVEVLSSEIGLEDARGARIYIADVNGDDYPDFIFAGPSAYKEPLSLMINEPNPDESSPYKRIFVDRTDESGINASRHGLDKRWSDVTVIADINNNGHNDIITGVFFYGLSDYIIKDTIETENGTEIIEKIREDQGFEVLLNDGNGNFTILEDNGLSDFQFVTEIIRDGALEYPPGLVSTTGMSLIDYDKDGNLDLVIGTFFIDYENNRKARDYIMKGNGDGTFTYVEHFPVENVREPLYGLNSTDFNNDGWMDIVSSPYCRSDGSIWKNNGDGTFTDVANEVNYSANHMNRHDNPQANLCQWEAMPADFNNDGYIDLLQVLVHGGYTEGTGRTTVVRNLGADNNFRFEWEIDRLKRDAPSYSHLGDMGANWFDLNNDGLQDVAIGQMSYPQANVHGQERLYVLLQNEDNYFDDISHEIGIFDEMKEAHSMEPIDFDMDGDNDLLFSRQVRDTVDGKISRYMKYYLLYNKIADASNHASVKLTSPDNSNRSNVGARITMYSDDLMQTREILAGNGHFGGQEQFVKNFGLGENNGNNYNRIDSIKVRWQTRENEFTTVYNPPMNVILDIKPDGTFEFVRPDTDSSSVIAFAASHTFFDTTYVDSIQKDYFEIVNLGNLPLTIDDIELLDTNGVFAVHNSNFNNIIAPNGSLVIDLDFQPDKRGIFEGLIKITSDADNGDIRYYDIKGYGFSEQPIIAYNTDILDFETVFVGDRDTLTLDIINKGEKMLTLFSFSFEDDEHFKIINNPMIEVNLDNEESFTLEIEFIPSEEIDYNTNLNINSSAYNTEEQIYPVTGSGIERKAIVSASLSSIAYLGCYVGESKSRTFTISSEGTKDLTINSFEFDSELGNSFYIADYSPPYVIEKDEKMEFELIFEPEEVMVFNGNMIVKSDAFNSPQLEISVSGIGRESTSVNDYVAEGNDIAVRAYPNPFSDEITISVINSNSFYQKGRIYITDMNGYEIVEIEPYGIANGIREYTYNPSNISSGSYSIIIETANDLLFLPIIYNK